MAVSPELHALIDQLSDHGLRVGQMFYNIHCGITARGRDPFYTDDNKMIEYFSNYLKNCYGETNGTKNKAPRSTDNPEGSEGPAVRSTPGREDPNA